MHFYKIVKYFCRRSLIVIVKKIFAVCAYCILKIRKCKCKQQATQILFAVSFKVSPLQNEMTQINVHDRIHSGRNMISFWYDFYKKNSSIKKKYKFKIPKMSHKKQNKRTGCYYNLTGNLICCSGRRQYNIRMNGSKENTTRQ